MDSIKKNTVSSKNQLKGKGPCFFINENGTGLRVLFVGNSITLHGILEEIGWHNQCGMAASSVENDYVHLCIEEIKKTYPDAAFAIAQVAEWERDYINGTAHLDDYSLAREFNPDIIIMRCIENCNWQNFSHEVFKREYKELINYFNLSGKANVIITEGFWKHPGNSDIKVVSEEMGQPFVALEDLGENDAMKAIGEYEHGGVQQHPNDRGMKNIADRICNALKGKKWI